MQNILNTKILLSGATILAAAALIIGATFAFFSDSETSSGNTLAAGAIDLQIDNTSYIVDYLTNAANPNGTIVASPNNTWEQSDLTGQLFFSFEDIKPGDIGEDTISIHVDDNDAWVCMAGDMTDTPDNGINEPEEEAGDETEEEGELQDYLEFAFWYDDGDNVYETGEEIINVLTGTAAEIFDGDWLAIADSGTGNGPLPGDEVFYVAKAWCFGDLVAVGDEESNENPAERNETGFTCDGEVEGVNIAQSDGILVDISFYAEQSRNNDQFACEDLPPFVGGQQEPEEELVGALLSSYEAPLIEACNAVVGTPIAGDITHTTIQGAVDAVSDDDTVCVDPSYDGNDSFPVNVDKDITIAGLGSVGDANVPGGFFISDSGVTITGLEFTDYSNIQSSANAAIYIHNEVGVSGIALANTLIEQNIFSAPGGAIGADAKGIITEIGSGVAPQATDISVLHNQFNGWSQAMFFNTTDNYEVAYNDILNNNVGVANDGPHNGSIHNNDFEGNIAEAVGVNPSANNGTGNNGILTVNTNNMVPGGAGNNVNWYGSSVLGDADVDATNNYWGDEAPAARTNNTAEVETTPAALVAYPEN